jgi:hypothetical protein
MIGAPQKSLPQQMLGAREARRLRSDDFHETTPEGVEALLAVERFDGPSWREVWGVEIAALAALRPDDLRRIVLEAIAPFYDETLAQRTATAREEWRELAADMLAEHPDYQAALDAIAAAREDALAAVDALHNAQRQAFNQLNSWEPPKFQIPIAEILQAPPPPLFSRRTISRRQACASKTAKPSSAKEVGSERR